MDDHTEDCSCRNLFAPGLLLHCFRTAITLLKIGAGVAPRPRNLCRPGLAALLNPIVQRILADSDPAPDPVSFLLTAPDRAADGLFTDGC